MRDERLYRRSSRMVLVTTIAVVFVVAGGVSKAADVEVRTPPGGNFVVKDNAGATTLLQVLGTGAVAIPGLPATATVPNALCFDASGVLGKCASAGPSPIVTGMKNMTLAVPGTTALASFHVAAGDAAGGVIEYTIVATDGGAQVATERGTMLFNATPNSITCTVQPTEKLHLGTVLSGCTPGFFNPGSQPGVAVFDNVGFSSPAPIVTHVVYFEIHNVSASATRLE